MIPANQTQVIIGVIDEGDATLTQRTNTSTTTLAVKGAIELPDALRSMMHPNATPFFNDAFSVHPEDAGASVESPPLSGKRMFVPWRFILPLIEQLRR